MPSFRALRGDESWVGPEAAMLEPVRDTVESEIFYISLFFCWLVISSCSVKKSVQLSQCIPSPWYHVALAY